MRYMAALPSMSQTTSQSRHPHLATPTPLSSPTLTGALHTCGHQPPTSISLDSNAITVKEVLSYVHNNAGDLLNNDPLLQRFTGMMDYMENKGLAAEEVFACLEVFVESNGQTIYNAFGNLSEVWVFVALQRCMCANPHIRGVRLFDSHHTRLSHTRINTSTPRLIISRTPR